MDLNYQLGIYVGEYIILTQLPTLSTDSLKSNRIIEVTEEEKQKWQKLEAKYFTMAIKNSFGEESSKLFYEHRKWYNTLLEKYLPETVDVVIPKVEITDMKEFQSGVEDALWDCDMSHYRVKDGFLQPNNPMSQRSRVIITREITPVPEKYR